MSREVQAELEAAAVEEEHPNEKGTEAAADQNKRGQFFTYLGDQSSPLHGDRSYDIKVTENEEKRQHRDENGRNEKEFEVEDEGEGEKGADQREKDGVQKQVERVVADADFVGLVNEIQEIDLLSGGQAVRVEGTHEHELAAPRREGHVHTRLWRFTVWLHF